MKWRVRGEILRWVAERVDRGGDLETEREILSVGGGVRRAHDEIGEGEGEGDWEDLRLRWGRILRREV